MQICIHLRKNDSLNFEEAKRGRGDSFDLILGAAICTCRCDLK
jgi:hypothetical protein